MTIMNRKSLTASLFAALIAIAPAVQAADGNSGSGEANFDEGQIESFAVARAEVMQLQQEYASKIQQADQEKASKLKQEAQQKMVSAVEDAGLDVKKFNSIARAAQSDQELASKIQNAAE